MSVSSVGSVNPYSYLQWPPQPGNVDNTGSSDATAPSDALQALFGAFTGAGSNDPAAPADGSAASCSFPQFSTGTMSALLSAQGSQDQAGGLQALIGKFDANSDGEISQSEFENAIGPDADKANVGALFNKLDANGDGSVDQDEMQSALQKAQGGGHHHHHHGMQGAGQQGSDPLQQLLSGTTADGATSHSSTNADGSTSTTITYADGSKVEMMIPGATDATGSTAAIPGQSGSNLGNILEQLIKLQASLFAPNTSTSLSI